MVITINKDTKAEEIDAALKKLNKSKKKSSLTDYYGKLKGAFGDAMQYQKKVRDEWS